MSVPGPRRLLTSVVLIGLTLGACSGSEVEPAETPTAPATVVSAPATPTAAAIGSTLASDGICQVGIPDDWSDDGTARGTTSTGARWTLFGNMLGSDTEWETAVNLLKNQQGSRPGAVVDEQPDQVTVTQAENRAIVVRRRFADRYCDLSVAATGAVPVETVMLWTQVAAGMAPAATGE